MTVHKKIRDYIAMNKEKFVDASYACGVIKLEPIHEGFYHDVRKKVINGETYDCVCAFRPEVLKNIILNFGSSDVSTVLYQMRKQELLKTKDSERNTFSYYINDYELKSFIVVYVKKVDIY